MSHVFDFDYSNYSGDTSQWVTGLTCDTSLYGTGYTITTSPSIGWANAIGTTNYSTYYPWKEDILTRSKLREFCENNEITKYVFEDLEERIPLGADLLTELIKIERINDPYVKKLLRNKKLKSI